MERITRNINLVPVLIALGVCALTWVSRHDAFFWDTVQLASKHAHHFYANGLTWLPLPPEIDSGHPPVFGYFLAIVWSIFGKTLVVSHFAMLPFLLLNVLLLWKIGLMIAGSRWAYWLPLLVLADPVLLGQSVMVSPDVVLVTSFLLAITGILGHHKWLIVVGILGLCAISMRGMMTATAIMVWYVLLPALKDFQLRRVIFAGTLFLPGFVFAAWFLWWHWRVTGWVGYHTDSPWAGAFQRVGTMGVIRNAAIIVWRWVDLGRVGVLLVVAVLGYWKWKHPRCFDQTTTGAQYSVLLLFICLVLLLSPSALLYQNLSAHRYFLPAFITCQLLLFQWMTHFNGLATNRSDPGLPLAIRSVSRTRHWVFGFAVLCLATGNLWVYPRGISMDWDSTLAHRSYHRLRADALVFLEDRHIDFSSVGSAFPNLNTGEQLLLNGDQRQFAKLDFSRNEYVLASNIFNDISEAEYAVLERDWTNIWEKKQLGVWIMIYQRK